MTQGFGWFAWWSLRGAWLCILRRQRIQLRDASAMVLGWMTLAGSLWGPGMGSPRVLGQGTMPGALVVAGTTAQVPAGVGQGAWSYLVLDGDGAVWVPGRKFVVMRKAGLAGSAGTYEQRWILEPKRDVTQVGLVLQESAALGGDLARLRDALAVKAEVRGANGTTNLSILGLLRDVPGVLDLSLEDRVVRAMQVGSVDGGKMSMLRLMARAQPGLGKAMGLAFFEKIEGVVTYEVREWVNNVAGDVVGRVTLDPGKPVVLPAPGPPFQVKGNEVADHLSIRLRWGVPNALRELSALQSGFNVWRIPASHPQASKFEKVAPTLSELRTTGLFKLVNSSPVMPPWMMSVGSGPGGAADPNDLANDFVVDNVRVPGERFVEGESYDYFVTARDLLGRDGLASAFGRGMACWRIRPDAPTRVEVENSPQMTNPALSWLKVTWRQEQQPTNRVTRYWIYRWTSDPSASLREEGIPIGDVAHRAGLDRNEFVDSGMNAPTEKSKTVWYTVRAVREGACDLLPSFHSAPAWGVLRERRGPEAPVGEVIGNCGLPVVIFKEARRGAVQPADPLVHHRFLTCERRDPGIAWVQFVVRSSSLGTNTYGPIYFPGNGNVVRVAHDRPPVQLPTTGTPVVECVVGTASGRVSNAATNALNEAFVDTISNETVFYCGLLQTTALPARDELLDAVLGPATYPANSPTADPSGMVRMWFDVNSPRPWMLIQASMSNQWRNVEIVRPDTNGLYWVLYPACIVGPLPPFRGIPVNWGSEDCDEHVAAGPEGGTVQPVRIRFTLRERTREYRLYRKLGDGAMTLMAQGVAAYDPQVPGKVVELVDSDMPPAGGRACYFLQLLDEHGNGSPLSLLGCKDVSTSPATPLLAEPKSQGTSAANAQVTLRWMCPPAGVARFAVMLKVSASDPGKKASVIQKFGSSPTQFTRHLGFNPKMLYMLPGLGLTAHDASLLTGYVGSKELGAGPGFEATVNVDPEVTYTITVSPMTADGKVWGASNARTFKWTPASAAPVNDVPWPQRPLPIRKDFTTEGGTKLMEAVAFVGPNNVLQDEFRPIGIRIGYLYHTNRAFPATSRNGVRNGWVASLTTMPLTPIQYDERTTDNSDPHLALFTSPGFGAPSDTILPMVLYRQQVANANFPRVSGDVVQASPLIERIPWKRSTASNLNPPMVTIPDTLFRARAEGSPESVALYLCDQLPVLYGARYRYLVVRFDPTSWEPKYVVEAGEAEVPSLAE